VDEWMSELMWIDIDMVVMMMVEKMRHIE